MKQVRRISSYGLIIAEDHLLLSLLNRGPNKGKYNLVGGGIDFAEDPSQTFKREVEEEAGYKIDSDFSLKGVVSELHHWKNDNGVNEGLHLIGIIYELKLDSKFPPKPDGDGDSSDGCKWFSINDVSEKNATSMVLKALDLLKLSPNKNTSNKA